MNCRLSLYAPTNLLISRVGCKITENQCPISTWGLSFLIALQQSTNNVVNMTDHVSVKFCVVITFRTGSCWIMQSRQITSTAQERASHVGSRANICSWRIWTLPVTSVGHLTSSSEHGNWRDPQFLDRQIWFQNISTKRHDKSRSLCTYPTHWWCAQRPVDKQHSKWRYSVSHVSGKS